MPQPTVSNILPDKFRYVLGHLPTGVTIVTALTVDGPIGMAASSVTSISVEPPLLLRCPARMSTTRPKIRAASRFCVNVMARHHEDASRLFPVKGAERSAGVVWHERPGEPAFGDARAWIDCELRDEHDPGDHTIEVADVLGLEAASDGRSLVFFRGSYGGFEE